MSSDPAALDVRPLAAGELERASALARRVFDLHVAPGYTQEGRATYHAFASVERMAARATAHRVFVAVADGTLVGMLEVRLPAHVAMLFVEPTWQRAGVGRRLLEGAFGAPGAWPTLTVNSAPDAVGAYERLGFAATGPEVVQDGIRFVPMRREG